MTKLRLIGMQALMACTILLASCGGGEGEGTPTPTLSGDDIQTLAVETFSAALTQTALAAPTNTPLPTLTASPTSAPFVTSTGGAFPGVTSTTSGGGATCYRLSYVSDVSIPDNTPMTPGQTFTKTWKVSNTGTCAWDAGFKFSFVSGEAMGGVTFTLATSVPANGIIDISIPMTAPTNKTGTLRGDWRMFTAAGTAFGDIVYVQIVVGGATGSPSTATNTGTPATATSTSTVTVTPTSTP
jgi:Ig-like domain from next to BRCA1 gene